VSGSTKNNQKIGHREIIRDAIDQRHQTGHRHNISTATFYNWKAKFGGLEVSDAKRLRLMQIS
jgi:Transposase